MSVSGTAKMYFPSSTVTVTATSLLALTTPFVQPSGCDTHFSVTTVPTWANTLDNVTAVTYLFVSQPVASCYPSGWDSVVPQSRFHFSPAVCPSAWTYYEMKAVASATTAFCCDSGYTLYQGSSFSNIGADVDGVQCIRYSSGGAAVATAWSSGVTSSSGSAVLTGSDTTVMLHVPWQVTWKAADRSSLTPSLPDLTSNMLVPTWTAGEIIPSGKYSSRGSAADDSWSMEKKEPALFFFLVVGVPIIFMACVSCCITCCVTSCKKKRRKKEAAARDIMLTSEPPAYTLK